MLLSPAGAVGGDMSAKRLASLPLLTLAGETMLRRPSYTYL